MFSRDCAGRGQLPSAHFARTSSPRGCSCAGWARPRLRPRPLPAASARRVWRYHGAAGPPRTPLVPWQPERTKPDPVVAARAAAMVSNPVHGLPFLPGTSFKDLTVRTSPAKPLSPPPGSPGEPAAGCVSARPREFVLFPFNPPLPPTLFSTPHLHPTPHPPTSPSFSSLLSAHPSLVFPLHPGSLLASQRSSLLLCSCWLSPPGSSSSAFSPSSFSLLHTLSAQFHP